MATRKQRLKIATADDLVDHREPGLKQPSLRPIVARRPPADALPQPPGAPSALPVLPPVRAPRRPPHRTPPVPPPAGEPRRSPVSPIADALRNMWHVVVDTPRSLLRRAAARRSGGPTAASRTEPPLHGESEFTVTATSMPRSCALPEFTADVTSTSVPAIPQARRTRPRPVRKTAPNPAAAALSASVEAAAADAVVTLPAAAPRPGFAGRFREFLERRASPVKSPANVPPSPIFAWIPRFATASRRYADGPATPDAEVEAEKE